MGVTVADLTPGIRIRHLKWDMTGTVRQCGGTREVRWDDVAVADEIGDEGVVFPADVEIIADGAR